MKKTIYFIALYLSSGVLLNSYPYFESYKVCNICNDQIRNGQKYASNFWGENYHVRHLNEYPSCYSCDRLISSENCNSHVHKEGGTQINDSRWVCNICIAESGLIYFESDAEELLDLVLTNSNDLGVNIPKIYNLNLIYENELSKIRNKVMRQGEKNPALMSLTLRQKSFANYIKSSTDCQIYILAGLEKHFFINCLAHELMHVWIAVNIGYEMASIYEEGLCNYLSFKILEKLNYHSYKAFNIHKIQRNKDPIYGTGFKKIKALADELGDFSEMLKFIKYNPNKFKSI